MAFSCLYGGKLRISEFGHELCEHSSVLIKVSHKESEKTSHELETTRQPEAFYTRIAIFEWENGRHANAGCESGLLCNAVVLSRELCVCKFLM